MNLNQQNDESQELNREDTPSEEMGEVLGTAEAGYVSEQQAKSLNKGTLMVSGMVLVAAAATFLMYVRGGPDAATASPGAAGQTITTFLNDGEQNIRNMEQMLMETQRVVDQALSYNTNSQVPLEELQTNPFRHETTQRQAAQTEDQELKRREEQRVAALQAVQALQLQSIMHGDTRRACMINGTLYGEGQQVNGFTIQRINPHSIIVQRGEYRFELRMQR
jgi:hypothetical protein